MFDIIHGRNEFLMLKGSLFCHMSS